jgi:hypothetical protein
MTDIDGIVGLGRISTSNGSNMTQFVAGLVDPNNTDLISNFTAYLDVGRKLV